ncbi:MAG TPA: phosphoribosylglycinamide formyltransferase [Alphaproteobacteria bacterium]|nr:phosphoribosylglycinamide formyltransferase [Alphaproteobacteria bacterium]
MAKLKIGVQISGRGSNLQALIDACRDPDFPAEIALVISNIPGAGGLERAKQAGIPTEVISHKNYATKQAFEEAIDAAHRKAGVELVCLAGFMRIISPYFVGRWRGKLINIHPSLLPAYPGLHTHQRALEAGEKFTGCTVHYVDEGMDTGDIILQAKVPVLPGDDEATLAARVLGFEHKIYPLAVRLISDGDVRYESGKAVLSERGRQRVQALESAA